MVADTKKMIFAAVIGSLSLHAAVFFTPTLQDQEVYTPQSSISINLQETPRPSSEKKAAAPKSTPQNSSLENDIITQAELEGELAIAYPKRSRVLLEEGRVELEFLVGVEGRPQNITVVQSSGFERLDLAAKNSLSRAIFRPSRINDKVIESTRRITIDFKLKDKE